jgi:LacI family transcriptional regulator
LYFERYFGYQKSNDDERIAGFTKRRFRKNLKTIWPLMIFFIKTRATALVVIDDIFALRTMQLAQMYGYQVPETLSMISF